MEDQNPSKPTPWSNYFKEFLMLFLAVFCGYLAEDFRENHQEKLMAEELAHKFFYELKEDSIALEKAISNRQKRDSAMMYLRSYFKDSSLTQCSKTFSIQYLYGFFLFTPTHFEPQDVILEQIRSGGTMEYFKDAEIQNLTGKLVAAMAKVKQRNDWEREVFTRKITEFNLRHADADWLLALTKYNGSVFDTLKVYEASPAYKPFHLVQSESINRPEFCNTIGGLVIGFSSTKKLTYRQYQVVNGALLKRLRMVYSIQ